MLSNRHPGYIPLTMHGGDGINSSDRGKKTPHIAIAFVLAAQEKTILLVNPPTDGHRKNLTGIQISLSGPLDDRAMVSRLADAINKKIGIKPERWIKLTEESGKPGEVYYQALVAQQQSIEGGEWCRRLPRLADENIRGILRNHWQRMISNHIQYGAKKPSPKVIILEPVL
jgi:hypothetical protein